MHQDESSFRIGFKFYIQSHRISKVDVFQRLDFLMILHNLNEMNIRSRNVVRGDIISTLKHIHILDIEFGNRLAFIFNLSVVFDFDSRHLLQDISDDDIGSITKGISQIRDCVVILPNLLRLNANFLQDNSFFFNNNF